MALLPRASTICCVLFCLLSGFTPNVHCSDPEIACLEIQKSQLKGHHTAAKPPLKSSNERRAVCHGKIFLALVESNMAVKLFWENPPSDKINKPLFPKKMQGVHILCRKHDGLEGYFVLFH